MFLVIDAAIGASDTQTESVALLHNCQMPDVGCNCASPSDHVMPLRAACTYDLFQNGHSNTTRVAAIFLTKIMQIPQPESQVSGQIWQGPERCISLAHHVCVAELHIVPLGHIVTCTATCRHTGVDTASRGTKTVT